MMRATTFRLSLCGATALAGLAIAQVVSAQVTPAPVPPSTAASGAPASGLVAAPATPALLPEPAAAQWSLADAQALLGVIRGIDSEGLFAKDYQPEALAAAIAAGEGPALNETATRLFSWLAEDLRDGRTPMTSRIQWFAVDPDMDRNPTAAILEKALAKHDVKGVLMGINPTHPDYAALRSALAKTRDPKQIALIRVNMDRWRWLARDLGLQYLITNVPEYQLRLTVNNQIINTYRTIVGKPGKTATPQLAEMVENVVFNPTWTVPQSIVVGEGLGARLLKNPAAAARENYKVTKLSDGMIVVVQQPGPGNSLGQLKIDMPNPHAIYLHDTPAKGLFNTINRAYSHGCVRTERAVELGMTMALLGADVSQEQVVQYATSGQYTKVPMVRPFPVYITYFTMARDVNGALRAFSDIYGRDRAVLASFNAPRQLHTMQRTTNEPVVAIDKPGV
jgi:murein L,D-transpeptidase YcbB/YkuD